MCRPRKAGVSNHRMTELVPHHGRGRTGLFSLRRWLAWAVLIGTWALSGQHAAAQPRVAPDPADVRPSAAYLLMIDHSGSMQTQDQPRGNELNAVTRWQVAKERAKEFLGSTPLKSDIWLVLFSDQPANIVKPPLETEEDREALLKLIDEQPEPKFAGTWLYHTLARLLELAQRLSEERDGRYISVLIFSDGKDYTSPPPWTKAKLEELFHQAVAKNDNLWVFFAPIGEEGTTSRDIAESPRVRDIGQYRYLLSIERSPSVVMLGNAATHPEQSFVLELTTTKDVWSRLEGETVRFDFESDADQELVVQCTTSASLRKGPIPIQLRVTNAGSLEGDREYTGKLRIHYPALKDSVVSAADFVQVMFQAGERPRIERRIPEDNRRFATGQPIQFKVITLRNADVTWEFGDGQTASGHDVSHVYNTPGTRRVKLSVVADPRIGHAEQEFDLVIVDVGVSINPIHEIVVEGLPHRFTCTGRGDVQRYEWLIDGNVFDGRTPRDAAEGQSEVTYTFQAPGSREMRVIGYAEGAKPESKMTVDVLPRPAITVPSGLTCSFGRPAEFVLEAPEGFEEMTWVFGDGQKNDENKRSVVHRYAQTGAFDVQASLAWKGERKLETRPVTVNVVAEPPIPRPQIALGGSPVKRVVVGQTVELVDHSSGDVARRIWTHNGKPLPEGQTTLPMMEPGEHELVLLVEGPADRSGAVPPEMRPPAAVMTIYVGKRPDHYKFWAAVIGAFAVLVVSSRWLFGNAPAQWRVYASNQGPPDENLDASVHVSRWWDRWRKTAVIPMRMLFPGCEHWLSEEGGDQHVRIVALRHGGRLDGTLEFSGEADDRVVSTPPTGDDTRTDYCWTDNRCQCETTECRNLHVRLVRKHRHTFWPLLCWLGVLLVLVGVIWLVYRAVYQGTL